MEIMRVQRDCFNGHGTCAMVATGTRKVVRRWKEQACACSDRLVSRAAFFNVENASQMSAIFTGVCRINLENS